MTMPHPFQLAKFVDPCVPQNKPFQSRRWFRIDSIKKPPLCVLLPEQQTQFIHTASQTKTKSLWLKMQSLLFIESRDLANLIPELLLKQTLLFRRSLHMPSFTKQMSTWWQFKLDNRQRQTISMPQHSHFAEKLKINNRLSLASPITKVGFGSLCYSCTRKRQGTFNVQRKLMRSPSVPLLVFPLLLTSVVDRLFGSALVVVVAPSDDSFVLWDPNSSSR